MKRLFWPLAGYIVVIFVVMGGTLFPGTTEMIWGDDIHRQYYFYRQFFNSFFKEGIWPWWNPYNFAGTPFMANPIVNIWYPPTWLFVVFPLNIAYSWHVALHLLWAMLGMYTLLRRVISNNPIIQLSNEKQPLITHHSSLVTSLSAWIAGLVFGLSGFFSARIWAGHVDVIAAASWIPWVVAAFGAISNIQYPISKQESQLQNLYGRREIVIAGVVLAMQLFAGYQTIAMFTLEAVAVFIGISLIASRTSLAMIIGTIAKVLLSIVLAIGLFAVVLIPQQELFRQSIRTYALPYSWNAYGSLQWRSLTQLFHPFPFGDQQTYTGPPPNFAEHAFFVGRWSLVVIVLGILMAILTSLKKGKSDTRPVVAFTPLLWSFAVIAVFGLWVSLGPNAPIDLQYILWKIVPMYKYLRIPPRHLILVVFGVSGLIGLAMRTIRSTRLGLMLAGLVTIEMILYARHFIALKPVPEARHDAELIRMLTQDKEPYRVLPNYGVWVQPRDALDFDAAMNYRIFSATGYDTMILRPYYEYIDAANSTDKPSILEHDVQVPYLNLFSNATDFLNIKYILVPRGYDPLGGNPSGQDARRYRLIREDILRDYRLYENKTVLPRFYYPDGSPVTIARYTPNEIILTTNNSRSAMLMSSEVFYPGWEGFIDGKKVDVQRASHAFRALFVPAGPHTVIYRYSPRIFLIGGAVTLLTILAILLMLRKNTI